MAETRDHRLKRLRQELDKATDSASLRPYQFGSQSGYFPDTVSVERSDFRWMLDELENHDPGKES